MTDADTCTSTVTGETFKISHQLNCEQSPNMQKKVRNNILGKLQMILDIGGTITSPTIENLIGKSLACKNIFTETLVASVTWDSLMLYQLH